MGGQRPRTLKLMGGNRAANVTRSDSAAPKDETRSGRAVDVCVSVGVYPHSGQNIAKMSNSETALGTDDASFSDAPSASGTNGY